LEVARLLRQAVEECPNALPEPAPIILFNDFGDNALVFEVHFWILMRTMMQARQIESELRHTIDRLLSDAKITIAFPQRDVHLDTLKPIEVNVRQIAEDQGLAIRRRQAA
jgi:small-conductance mechanosensitive channel